MNDQRLLLAVDTATRFAGIALYDGEIIRSEMYWQSQDRHSVELMPAVVCMLDQQGISAQGLAAIAVSIGPGSFTGLRIGLSVAKGVALAQSIPILGVPTLDIMAFPHQEQRRPVWAIIQAGRGRLCAARYERRRGRWRQHGGSRLTTLSGLAELLTDRCLVCGELSQDEIGYLAENVPPSVAFARACQSMRRAACLAELGWQRLERGQSDELTTLSPIYLHGTQE